MTYLLDTCVISEVTKPNPAVSVLDWLAGQEEIGLYLSVLTIGEIRKGIARLLDSRKKSALVLWVQQEMHPRFAGRIFDVDQRVSERWGDISAAAELRGRRIPVVDGLIAATAIENGLTLATRNVRDMAPTGVDLFNPWQAS